MASKYISPTEENERSFNQLEHKIISTFQKLIEHVEKRRDKLLTELKHLKCELDCRIAVTLQNISNLENVRKGIESLEVEGNETSDTIQASLYPIITKIEELEKQIPLLNCTFECNLNPLKDEIDNLGKLLSVKKKSVVVKPAPTTYAEINDLSPQYELPPIPGRKAPPLPPPRSQRITQIERARSQSLTLEKSYEDDPKSLTTSSPSRYNETKGSAFCYGDGSRISNPKSTCYDRVAKKVYIISYDDPKVCVFSSDGKFIKEFGEKELQGPVGICVFQKNVYVADEKLNTIFKFNTEDFHLTRKKLFIRGSSPHQLGLFRGITMDRMSQIHVVDNENHRISVLNSDLNNLRVYGQDYLQHPKDICTSNIIYVLDLSYPHCLHGISWEGNKILSIINHDEIDTPLYFCIVPNGNFIISGVFEQNLKVFSEEGTYLYTTEVKARKPRGICLIDKDTIACAYAEGKYVIYNIKI